MGHNFTPTSCFAFNRQRNMLKQRFLKSASETSNNLTVLKIFVTQQQIVLFYRKTTLSVIFIHHTIEPHCCQLGQTTNMLTRGEHTHKGPNVSSLPSSWLVFQYVCSAVYTQRSRWHSDCGRGSSFSQKNVEKKRRNNTKRQKLIIKNVTRKISGKVIGCPLELITFVTIIANWSYSQLIVITRPSKINAINWD